MRQAVRLARMEIFDTRLPLAFPFETSFGRVDHREPLIVRLEDRDGAFGFGEAPVALRPHFNAETNVTAWHVLSEFAAPLLRSKELSEPAEVARALAPIRGHHMAKAAVEFALADLIARRRGVPIARVFGAEPRPIEVGVSLGIESRVEALVERVAAHVSRGYRRVKLKIAPGWDVAPTAAVRAAFPDLRLMVDANGAYSPDHAKVLAELDWFGLLLLEQHLDPEDLVFHRDLARTVKTKIALDESTATLGAVRAALELEACSIVNVKPARLGGPTAARLALEATVARGKGAFLGGMLESGIGRAANLALAALPGFTIEPDLSASDRYYEEDLVDPPFRLDPETGCVSPAPGPGLGARVQEDVLARRSVRRQSFSLGSP
ncbi:o-succinylbenzoate synthase [bacterium]|nr:o-succinylbenzoate synthase [bacterium]